MYRRLVDVEAALATVKNRSKSVMETTCAQMLTERRYWPREDGQAYVADAIARSRVEMPKCVERAVAALNQRIDDLAANRSDIELDQESRLTRKTKSLERCIDDTATLMAQVKATGTLVVDLVTKYEQLWELMTDCEKDIMVLSSNMGLDLTYAKRCGAPHHLSRGAR